MSSKQRSTSKLSRGVLLAAVGLFILQMPSCSSSSPEKKRLSELAGGCTFNSDCGEKLVCTFERCHQQCQQDVDCTDPLRCVKSQTEGVYVCQLQDEANCERDKDCPGDQTCGIDLECRDVCQQDDDCVDTQICANSNECASIIGGKDVVDGDGNIVSSTDGGGGAPGEGPTGVSGNAGTGGSQGGAAGSAAVGEAGSPDAAGSGGSGDPTPTDYYETEDGLEQVENDTRETPAVFPPRASIWLHPGDEDWFALAVPDDGKAHLLAVTLAQAAGENTAFQLLAGSNYSEIGRGTSAAGATWTVYASVGPNTTTLFKFTKPTGSARVDLSLDISDEADEYEPNNDTAHAAPIGLGSEVTAQLLNGYIDETSTTSTSADYFRLDDLAIGKLTVKVLAAPGVELAVRLIDASTNAETLVSTGGVGLIGDLAFTIKSAGTYYLRFNTRNVSSKDVDTPRYSNGTLPASMSEQYKFRVDQN